MPSPHRGILFPNNSAIMLGIGYRGADHFVSNGFLMRAAYKLTNPWYITVSYSVGHGNTFMVGAGYTIFGRKIDALSLDKEAGHRLANPAIILYWKALLILLCGW